MHLEKHSTSSAPPECSLTAGSWEPKLVEAAVIRGIKKETLISLQLLKRWDMINESFPNQTISDDIESKTIIKHTQFYSAL